MLFIPPRRIPWGRIQLDRRFFPSTSLERHLPCSGPPLDILGANAIDCAQQPGSRIGLLPGLAWRARVNADRAFQNSRIGTRARSTQPIRRHSWKSEIHSSNTNLHRPRLVWILLCVLLHRRPCKNINSVIKGLFKL